MRAQDSEAKSRGITSVPYFELLDHNVNGAWSTLYSDKLFKSILNKI